MLNFNNRGGGVAHSKFDYRLTEDGFVLLEGWARSGLTDEQIAHNCRIAKERLEEDMWQS